MITLLVKKYKGRVVLAEKNPKGVHLLFVKAKPVDVVTKRIKTMWKDYDRIYNLYPSRYEDRDKPQQQLIKRMIRHHFSLDVKWKSDRNNEGWPTPYNWDGNRRWFNKQIRQVVKP